MKKATKEEFITLLEKIFSEADFDLRELQGYLSEKLNKYNKINNPYIKALRNLSKYINLYLEKNTKFTSLENVYQFIIDTVEILNTPLKELEKQEDVKQKQLELETYHKELPLKLLELLAKAQYLGLEYKVCNPKDKDIEVILYEPYYNDSYKEIYEVKIKLNGQPWEYREAVDVIQKIKDTQAAELEKENLIKTAKTKLTKEELTVLGLDCEL